MGELSILFLKTDLYGILNHSNLKDQKHFNRTWNYRKDCNVLYGFLEKATQIWRISLSVLTLLAYEMYKKISFIAISKFYPFLLFRVVESIHFFFTNVYFRAIFLKGSMSQLSAAMMSWVGCFLKDSDLFILFQWCRNRGPPNIWQIS